VLARIYDPRAYFGRVRRMVLSLNKLKLGPWIGLRESLREIDHFFKIMWHVTLYRPEMRRHVWALLLETLVRNPGVIRDVIVSTVFYIYLGPLSAFVVERFSKEITDLEAADARRPRVLPPNLDEVTVRAG
jgi:hypothetical protein